MGLSEVNFPMKNRLIPDKNPPGRGLDLSGLSAWPSFPERPWPGPRSWRHSKCRKVGGLTIKLWKMVGKSTINNHGKLGNPLVIVNKKQWKTTMLLMGKSTISIAMFNSYVTNYRRVTTITCPRDVKLVFFCLQSFAVNEKVDTLQWFDLGNQTLLPTSCGGSEMKFSRA